MKFKKIEIENFKGIKALSYEPKHKTTALLGENGKGKTSFKEAVFAGISGEFPNNCIANGETFCRVGLMLNDDTEFERMIISGKPNKTIVNGRATTVKALNEMLENNIGISKDALKIVSSSDVVQAMKPGEFGNFIMSYIPEELNVDTIIQYTPNITSKIEEKIIEIFPARPEKFGMEEIQKAYNFFFETRKNNKRELMIKQANIDSFSLEKPTKSIEDIDRELDLIMQKEGAYKASLEAIRLYNSILSEKENVEKRLLALKNRIDSITAKEPNISELKNINESINICNEKILAANTMIRTLNKDIAIFNNTLNNLATPICPISNKLVCTTDKTAIKEELADLVSANKEALKLQNDIINVEKECLKQLEYKKAEYDINNKKYNEKVILSSQYEEQLRNVPKLPVKPAEVENINYSAEKIRLQKERNDCQKYKSYLDDVKKCNILLEDVSLYDFLCKAFAPKGPVMENILHHYMNYFGDVCNDICKRISPNFEIKFISEDGVNYLVKTDNGEFKAYENLSSGERLLTMFVILDMLNSLSGLRILMLDDLDKLDINNFSNLLKLIQTKDIQDKYDHIFICAVNHKDIVDEFDKYKTEMDFI